MSMAPQVWAIEFVKVPPSEEPLQVAASPVAGSGPLPLLQALVSPTSVPEVNLVTTPAFAATAKARMRPIARMVPKSPTKDVRRWLPRDALDMRFIRVIMFL